MRNRLFHLISAMLIAQIAAPCFATCGGGGGGGLGGLDSARVYDVPWKRLSDQDTPPKAGLVLYWFPASEMEYKTSSLKVSRVLSLYAGRCVAMCAANIDSPLGQKLVPSGKAPLVVLATPDSTVLAKMDGQNGDLKVSDVENLLNDEVEKRRQKIKTTFGAAMDKIDAGDKKGAIDDLKSILEQKCLLPGFARRAAKELKRLGVDDVSEIPEGPKFDKATTEKITSTMLAGLKAEESSKYDEARQIYEKAHRIDPADPVPMRYLAELYRHDIGDWDRATEIYDALLKSDCDPLTRAVALHGLGKITVHNGNFARGEQMMEDSVKTYPLPLAYRNLAVYWNSEGDSAKCNQNIDKALKLAPDDPFNRVFAAVFMAGNGRKEEALKIAQDNEGLLPASYNLAAIYAQLGMKDKALQFLRRHFFEYERNQAVRAEEMMEARVDRVFDSLLNDKDFLALTSGADGKLPIPGNKMMTAH